MLLISPSVQAQVVRPLEAYDIANASGDGPDQVINTLDIQRVIDHLSGRSPSPTYLGSSRLTCDVSSALADTFEPGFTADNAVTPLDVLLVINFVATEGVDNNHSHSLFQNQVLNANVNASQDSAGQQTVTPLDILLVINYLSANGSGYPPYTTVSERTAIGPTFYPFGLYYSLDNPETTGTGGLWYDVTGDGKVDTDDIQAVINYLSGS